MRQPIGVDARTANLLDPTWPKRNVPPESGNDLAPAWALATQAGTIPLRDLEPLARVLASTDGTVTEILEAWADEPVAVDRLRQRTGTLEHPIAALDAPAGTSLIRREVLLVGADTRRALLYAESVVVTARLPAPVTSALLEGRRPIGRILRESRLETFREILCCRRETAGTLSVLFAMEPDDAFVVRVYRVLVAGRPALLIAEKFPGRRSHAPIRQA